MKVTIQDLRAAGLCSKGSRKVFVDAGLSWSDFIENGIDHTVLEEKFSDHAMAKEALEVFLNGRK